ncbi:MULTISPECIES: nuclear transport factor 2 family protein [unclassified Legionella]|uniref:YybH family protein n=1 Tax=unclassified Legionella TaxID=2622702 RepID=UPI0010547FE7|nr:MULTISPECIES: nuclear transport factor 2 family protein [unclassified Legionella]MDI9819428.1 nuclear transport factor 2 family protein [Legionella sp. PL877]
MGTVKNTKNEESLIRKLIEETAKAISRKDIDKIMSQYAPNIRSFDAVSQLQFKGIDAYKKHWEACLSYCPGEAIFEIHELEIEVNSDLALCHFLNRCGGTNEKGEIQDSWMRATVCYRKVNDSWKIVHEHFSVPFDMKTGNTLFDLQP